MRPLLLFLLFFAGAVLACDRVGGGDGTDHSFKDQGKVCAFPEGAGPDNAFLPPPSVTFQADRTATITVMAPTCLSSSCSKDPRAACTAVLEGNVIKVTSTATFREEGRTCTSDCGALVARCTTPPLPAATYTVQHGADRVALVVPSMGPAPCAGMAP